MAIGIIAVGVRDSEIIISENSGFMRVQVECLLQVRYIEAYHGDDEGRLECVVAIVSSPHCRRR